MQEFSTSLPVIYTRSGRTTKAYQAYVPIKCDRCHKAIEAGAYYTRQITPGCGLVCIICQNCYPFAPVADSQERIPLLTDPDLLTNDLVSSL